MNKRILNIPALFWPIIFIVLISTILLFIKYQKKEPPIKIGAIIPITGPGGQLGVDVRDGMMLAIDEINTRNGINRRKIELIIEDSKTDDVQESKKAFIRLEKSHKPLLYISALSSVSMALAPLAEENKVVQIGLMVVTSKFPGENKWSFRYFYTAKIEAQPILLILQKLKINNLGIIYVNDEYGLSVFEAIKKGFGASGGIIRSEVFEMKKINFKEQIEKLINIEASDEYHADLVFSTGGASDPLVVKMPEANGVYTTAPIIYSPNYLYAREAKQKYEDKYNKPFNQSTANGYDFIKIFAGLMNNKDISRESIKTALEEGFIYSGVFGTLKVKSGDHEINFPLFPVRIVDGKLEY